MAIVAGSNATFGTVGKREDLADIIYNHSREDTPLQSMIARTSASNTTHEWQTDTLRKARVALARQVQGNAFAATVPARRTRVGNYMQIVSESVLTTATQDAVDAAGVSTETNYETLKRGKELKLDIEASLFQNTAGAIGDSVTPAVLAGLPAWLQSNVSRGVGGLSSGHASGVPAAGATDGTKRTFVFGQVQTVMQSCYNNGAKPTILMMGTATRVALSNNFPAGSLATHTIDIRAAAPTFVLGSVDVVVTNFGKLRVVPNAVMATPGLDPDGAALVGGSYRDREAYLIDRSMLSVAYLRPFMMKDQPVAGDISAAKLLVAEYTLRVNSEAGLGVVADLDPALTI